MLRSVFHGGLTAVFLAASLAGGMASTPARAQQAVAQAPLSAYGALPSLEMVKLSPSGQRLAFITVTGEDRTLVLLDLSTREQIGGAGIGMAKVRDLDWLGEDRILVTTSKTENIPQLGIVRAELFSSQIYDPGRNRIVEALKDTRDVFPMLFSSAEVIKGEDPEVLVRAYAFSNPDRLDLFRVDLQSGRGTLAEVMGQNVTDFVLDTAGRSLARSEYDSRSQEWSLHLRQGGGFRETWETVAPIDTPNLIGLGLNGDSVVIAADRPDMSQAGREDAEFFDVNLATGVWRAVRFEFNPDGLLFHPVTRRLIGATRGTDAGRLYAFADPAADSLWASIRGAFAGRSPELVSFSDDLRKAVVYTSGPRDSGSYHLINLDAGRVTPVGGAYVAITPDRVAPVRAVSYTAADGLEIHGYLTTPPGVTDPTGLPLVVLAHGGPASHDVMGFDWWAQAMASRGYAVLQPNFRGSTGYGDAFREAGYGEWGRKMQTDLSDGVRWLAEQGVIDAERVCIVGASYGGYAALAGPTIDRGVYRCAVSVAGVSDLRVMVEEEASRGARRENSTTRYWNRFMGADGLGDRSLDARSPARLAAQADAPILLIHGRDDTVVPIDQSRIMERALRQAGKPVEFIELEGEDHGLSRGATRERMLTETMRFLQAHNPAN
ncbi:S9 family peptidase [Brevundimonas sp.]|uniref:alpha/beta hydrolase family protein n=1 Tax=Brevundimonas sp. TaxID=1871086 RepID=UPI0027314424|nr:S9 family peptidase [Brevundimonas sp.]MDP1912856.1 S9 family peptidase [Brevundimonas sp.]